MTDKLTEAIDFFTRDPLETPVLTADEFLQRGLANKEILLEAARKWQNVKPLIDEMVATRDKRVVAINLAKIAAMKK